MSIVLGLGKGILITGGQNSYTSVELFNPNTNTTCHLPSLPNRRYKHVAAGNLICAGDTGLNFRAGTLYQNCTEFSKGTWITTNHTLIHEREYIWAHWIVEEGIYLFDPHNPDSKSELIRFDGTVVNNPITMEYSFEYVSVAHLLSFHFTYF